MASLHIHAFLEFPIPLLRTIILPNTLTTVETMDSREQGTNPVTMIYHQSSESILAEPGIDSATLYSEVLNATD